MTYEEARVYLDEVSKYGSVLGLDTIRELLYELGNPQNDLRFIHIAGTNGKGSVLAYISTILSETGFRVGRYVSPTVIGYLEKIQINGNWISEKVFTELVEEVQRAIVRMETNGKASPTVFEVETAIAFLYFQREHCDYVVLETGLGGILDATNIISNTKVAVFTNISRDHMGFLGNTLEEITENKAGIIKPGCVVVSAAQEEAVRKENLPEVCEYIIDFDRFGQKQTARKEKAYNGVVLSTMHSSKGKEWPVVFCSVTKLHGRDLKPEDIPEKNRLLFVACTRAKEELYISGVTIAVSTAAEDVKNLFLDECLQVAGEMYGDEKEEFAS